MKGRTGSDLAGEKKVDSVVVNSVEEEEEVEVKDDNNDDDDDFGFELEELDGVGIDGLIVGWEDRDGVESIEEDTG